MNTGSIIDALAERSRQTAEPGDYENGGLVYCGKCNTPRQCRVSGRIVWCACKCRSDAYDRRKQEDRDRELKQRIDSLRVNGIQDKHMRGYTFAGAGDSKTIRMCRRYVDRFAEMYGGNTGLLFWGDVGTGKTFAAACIANALIDKGIPVMVTSFPRILGAGFDRQEIVEQMKNFKLLVIDDLGAERQSEYALETVYMVIDERYKTGKPVIITTNLSLQQIEKPQSMDYSRIYSRVREMCIPVKFSGEDVRKSKADEKMRIAREVLSGD